MNNNITHTFAAFLKALGAKVSASSATDYIETHPDYPSMAAYSDALAYWQIENVALRISPEQLPEMPLPFITFSRRNGGTFSLIRSVGKAFIERLDTELGWVNEKAEEFYADWSGVVLLAEVSEESGEKDFTTKRTAERLKQLPLPLAISCLGFVTLLSVASAMPLSWWTLALLLIQLTGAVIGSLLLVKSIDTHNAFINRLCNSGSKFSCQSILDSDAAKITDWLSWSDMGFLYGVGSFSGLLLALHNPTHLPAVMQLTFLLSTVGVVFSFYSFYYQGIKAKIWCPLCIGFMAVFWASAAISYVAMPALSVAFSLSVLLSIASGYLLSSAFLLLFKPTAIAAQKADATQKELSRMKNNPEIFNALLASQRTMPYLPAKGIGVVELGCEDAKNRLTIITNPHCSYCAKMHKKVNKLIHENHNVMCELVFINDGLKSNSRIIKRILSLPKNMRVAAVNNWFDRGDNNVEIWEKEYLHFPLNDLAKEWEKYQQDWANDAEVKATPTIFLNGKLLPDLIKIEDLNYIQIKELS